MSLSRNTASIVDIDDLPMSAAPGATKPSSALYLGGDDGTNLRALRTDTTGRAVVAGAGAVGATPVGNPLYLAAQDGTNLQALRSSTAGRLEMVGAAADGAAAVGNPVQIGGKDGSGDIQALSVDSSGNLNVNAGNTSASTAALSSVAASVVATGVDLLAANASRLGATISNDGNKNLYVAFAATVSVSAFTVKIPPNGYYELPFDYTGQIRGIWSPSANGFARITELTA